MLNQDNKKGEFFSQLPAQTIKTWLAFSLSDSNHRVNLLYCSQLDHNLEVLPVTLLPKVM